MSETPPEEPQQPTPPPPSGYNAPPPGYSAPPPAYNAPPPAYNAPPPAYGAAPVGAPLSDSDQRLWATLSHAGAILLGFVAPLVVWLIYKGRGQFVEDQAKEALNFQILVVIAWVAAGVLSFVGIGLILYPLIWIGNLVFCILAAMAANKGQAYRYPFNWRIVK